MDIAGSSPLLHSRYRICVPLVPFTSNELTKTHNYNYYNYDVAFLSSVEAASEVCVGLACIAQPHHSSYIKEREEKVELLLLVFVPIEIPAREVFVELPISAFKENNNNNRERRRGLQLLELNSYSFLCCNVKDGLPPRKGLFITFKTQEAHKRFHEALQKVICEGDSYYYNYNDLENSKNVHSNKKINSSLAILRRKPMVVTAEEEEEKEEKEKNIYINNKKQGFSNIMTTHKEKNMRETSSFIDNLLLERERRREIYKGNTLSHPLINENRNNNNNNNDNFSTMSKQYQTSHPKMWNIINGVAERQLREEWRKQQQQQQEVEENNKLSEKQKYINKLPNSLSIEEREALFLEVQEAIEAFDNMNQAQGLSNISLMGAGKEFLRQHQNKLWRIEENNNNNNNNNKLTELRNNQYSSHETELLQLQEGEEESIKQNKQELPVYYTQNNNNNNNSQTIAEEPIVTQSTLHNEKVELHQNLNLNLNEELHKAREAESRILSSFHKVTPKLLNSNRVFGSAPKTPIPRPSFTTIVNNSEEREKQQNEDISTTTTTTTTTIDNKKIKLDSTSSIMQEKVEKNKETIKELPQQQNKTLEENNLLKCGEGWKSVLDPKTGKNYYIHIASKKTTWKIEDTFPQTKNQEEEKNKIIIIKDLTKCGPGWSSVIDSNSGRTYYVNKSTNSTTWKLEETFMNNENSNTSSAPSSAEILQSQKNRNKKITEWAERKDPASGKVYYYNKKTKQTTWKRVETDLDSL